MVPSPKPSPLDPEALLLRAQEALDLARRMPDWLAWTLLGAALLFTLLHRHALRPLSGLLVGAALAGLSLLVLAPALGPGSAVPGLVAVLGAGAALALGLARPGAATAVACAAALGAAGGLAAVRVAQAHWGLGAAPFALLGFFFGLASHRSLGLVLPPVFAAAGATLGAARLLAPAPSGGALPALGEAMWAGLACALLSLALLALSFEREHRARRRRERRELQMGDAALKKKLERDRAAYKRATGAAAPGERTGDR